MIVLDTQNDYEMASGTFGNAIGLDIHNFHEFPKALNNLPLVGSAKARLARFPTRGVCF